MPEDSVTQIRLSPQQQRLWSLTQAGSQAFQIHGTVSVSGRIDVAILKAALEHLAQRHTILRTVFQRVPWMTAPVQEIVEDAAPALHAIDLRDQAAQEAKLESVRQESFNAPFDHGSGPLLHATLITLADDRHHLLLNLSPLAGDATTLDNLLGELAQCYAAAASQQAPDEPALQYADIAEVLNELVEGEDTEAGAEYWRAQWTPAHLAIQLPFAKAQALNAAAIQPAAVPIELPDAVMARIAALTEDGELTPSIVLLASWYALLWRLTDQANLVIGTAFDGRTYEGMDTALGLLARYLPLRYQMPQQISFRSLLAEINSRVAEAYEWQDYFAWTQVASATGDQQSFWPYSFDFATRQQPEQDGEIRWTLESAAVCIEPFALKLSAVQTNDGALLLALNYDANLFQHGDITRLAQQLAELIANATATPDQPIAAIDLVSKTERRQLLAYNDTARPYPSDLCVHELFEAQAERTPDAPAVVFADRPLSYAELNTRANQLARHLVQLGVGPDTRVAICVERSPELVVSILGVLKAGGAYVPLDLTYPTERLAFILDDTQAPVLLTQQHIAQVFASAPAEQNLGSTIVHLDADWPAIAAHDDANLTRRADPDNLAYLIYTSGSTGQPKGTMVPHRGLVNYLTWCTNAYAVEQGDGSLVHSPVGFDLTVTSLFAPLLVGQRVILLPEQQGVEGLEAALRESRNYSLIKITPTHLTILNQLLAEGQAAGRASALVIGGEMLMGESLRFWRNHAPGTRLINEYGPTETVVGCVVYEVPADGELAGNTPIGRPIANTQLYVLDQQGRLAPAGAVGELYIGGAQVTRGYLNRPDLTAERFVPDSFSQTPGARLYRTGDLVRYRADGNLEFLGRNDHQVKLRGFRIELGEIEAVLLEHPAVREAVIAVRDDRLVAYVVENKDGETDGSRFLVPGSSQELRQFLGARLPDYMVPALFVTLPALPLTSNGKVDRSALPAPSAQNAPREERYVAPRTPVEEQLAAIWSEVLRLERIGVNDNFFELGGDSILSIQIVAKANKAGLRIQPRDIFVQRTISALAEVARTASPTSAEQGLVAGAVPLTPIQRWLLDQPDHEHRMQIFILEVRESIDSALLAQAFEHVLAHHDALRLRFSFDPQTGWHQEHAAPAECTPLAIVDRSALAPEQQQAALAEEIAALQAGFDLSAGVIRAAYIDRGAQQSGRLLLAIHQLAADERSLPIVVADLQTAYAQLATSGATVTLPAKTRSFKQWAERLAAQDVATPEREYWLSQTQTIKPLPLSRPALETTTSTLSVALSSQETSGLLDHVRATYHMQLDEIMITALAQTIAAWTGDQTPVFNLVRPLPAPLFDDLDLSRTVGWFATSFPARIDLRGVAGADATLKAVKEQARHVPNHGLGYGLLRYRDNPAAQQLERLPEPQISLSFGAFEESAPEDGLFAVVEQRAALQATAYPLEISASVRQGQLHLEWACEDSQSARSLAEELSQRLVAVLQTLIAESQSPDAGGYTPSDFPDEDLSEEDLDNILAQLNNS